jgi:site-specific DNA recombinase
VARLLNQAGYRTRKGARFTDTTILRLLEDTTAKGMYRANHTYRDDKGKLIAKPESDWVFTPVEAIVSEDLWKQCNDILQARKDGKAPGPKTVQLFAGLLFCGCGAKMYVFARSPKYVCPKCRNKIPIVDIEAIFKEELEDFFISKDKVQAHLSSANTHLAEKKEHLAAHTRQMDKLKSEMRKVYDLYQSDQISPEGFGKLYKPLEEQERALAAELPRLQGEIDALEMHQLSADEIVSEATNLHRLWPKFTPEEKRRIVESITEKITVAGDQIDITFWNPPSSEELTKRQRNLFDTAE